MRALVGVIGLVVLLVSLLLLSSGSFWIWYKYSGSLPKKVFAFRFEDSAFYGQSRFFSRNELFPREGRHRADRAISAVRSRPHAAFCNLMSGRNPARPASRPAFQRRRRRSSTM